MAVVAKTQNAGSAKIKSRLYVSNTPQIDPQDSNDGGNNGNGGATHGSGGRICSRACTKKKFKEEQ